MRYSVRERKLLIQRIQELGTTAHEEIFKVLQEGGPPLSHFSDTPSDTSFGNFCFLSGVIRVLFFRLVGSSLGPVWCKAMLRIRSPCTH